MTISLGSKMASTRSLERVLPHNVTYDGLCYTINTRYEDAAISDYTHPKHCKTCVMYVYEQFLPVYSASDCEGVH